MIIAIDGPSGAGKSTVAKLLAARLNLAYLDTGAMYRAVGLKAYESGVSVADEDKIAQLLAKTTIDIVFEGGANIIMLDGRDVSTKIREHHISKLASDVSALKTVRLAMVELQREIASRKPCILDGRDIGTFVLPNADYKFFLTAGVDERAKRRYEELKSRGQQCDFEQLKQDIIQRDYNDSHRDFAPLKKADDAIEIDSTLLGIEQVVEKMLSIISAK